MPVTLQRPPLLNTNAIRDFLINDTPDAHKDGLRKLFQDCDAGPRRVPINSATMQHIANTDGLKLTLMGRRAPDFSVVAGLKVAQVGLEVDRSWMKIMHWPVPDPADPDEPSHMFGGDESGHGRFLWDNPDIGGFQLDEEGESKGGIGKLCKTGWYFLQFLNETGLAHYNILTIDLAGIGPASKGSGLSNNLDTPEGRNTRLLVDETLKGWLRFGITIFEVDSKYAFDHVFTSLFELATGPREDRHRTINVPVDLEKGLQIGKDGKPAWCSSVAVHIFFDVKPSEDTPARTVLLIQAPHFCTASFTHSAIQIFHANSLIAAIRGDPIDIAHTVAYYDKACGGFMPDDEWYQAYGNIIDGLGELHRAKWEKLLDKHRGSPHAAYGAF
jgi:hypothetical protein